MVLKPDHSRTEKVWKKIKLHGTQTCKLGFFFGLEEDKLHGTQTYVNSPTRRVWKGVKLHGTQTSSRAYSGEAGFRRR